MFKKKMWCVIAVLCLIVSIVCVSSLAAEDVPQLVNGYYEIYTADQLYWFAAQVNGGEISINGKLMADIVVNQNVLKSNGALNGNGSNFRVWTPIGTDSNRMYEGTFDGNGKTVSGLYFNDPEKIYVGLFGYVYGGNVCNVGVVGSYLCGNTGVGGVVGWNNGNGTVTNCYNTGSVKGAADVGGNIGGVVGISKGNIIDCYNTGSVSGAYNVGGVVGSHQAGTVSNSHSNGRITARDRVGGVVGLNFGGTVSNSYNAGTVTGSGQFTGGLAGDNQSGCTISDSYNAGTVSGNEKVGGVAGENGGDIRSCYSIGSVSGKDEVGGVAGWSYGMIDSSYNTGSISATGSYASAGGVAGSNSSMVNNCYNSGSVSAGGNAGGVVGYNMETVSNCYNTGNVTLCTNPDAEAGFDIPVGAGGVAGFSGSVYGISNCYYLSGCADPGNSYGMAMTDEQFTSGEVAYLLHGNQMEQIWGQLVGAGGCPVLGGEKVYGENGSYHNACIHNWVGGGCTEGVTCLVCGAVGDYFPGHQWVDATCTAPKTCSACGLTDGKPLGHQAYSYSYDKDTALHIFTCPACGDSFKKGQTDGKKFAFNTAAPALSVDIVMNIAVTLPTGFSDPYLVVQFNGATTTLTDYTINQENGRCVFAFPGINPQTMGDTFHATLYAVVDGVQVGVELDYSMLKYINSQLKKAATPANLITALSDLVMYGEANQIYEGYKTDALLSSLLEDAARANLKPSTFKTLSESYNKQTTSGTKNPNIDLKGVSLSLGSRVLVRVTVFCTDAQTHSVKATINGEEHVFLVSELPLADGYTDRYVLEFDQIRATQFGEEITFSFLDADGNQVGRTLNYSVYTYVQKNQNADNENLVNLLKAIYNYGESVKKI